MIPQSQENFEPRRANLLDMVHQTLPLICCEALQDSRKHGAMYKALIPPF